MIGNRCTGQRLWHRRRWLGFTQRDLLFGSFAQGELLPWWGPERNVLTRRPTKRNVLLRRSAKGYVLALRPAQRDLLQRALLRSQDDELGWHGVVLALLEQVEELLILGHELLE